jgi:hypothetical protein
LAISSAKADRRRIAGGIGKSRVRQSWLLVVQLLAFGFWLLAFGFWLLAFGFKLSDLDFQLLAFIPTA